MAYFGHGQQRSLAHTTVFWSAAVPDGHGVSERGFEAPLGGQRSANLIKGWNSCSFCLEFRVSNFPLTSKALLPVKNSKSQSTHSQPQECQLKRTSIIEKVAKLELPVDEQAIKVEITKLHSILGGSTPKPGRRVCWVQGLPTTKLLGDYSFAAWVVLRLHVWFLFLILQHNI